jgi:hypothetical protein
MQTACTKTQCYLVENLSARDNDCCELDKNVRTWRMRGATCSLYCDTAAIEALASALLCTKAITRAIEHDEDGILVLRYDAQERLQRPDKQATAWIRMIKHT